VVFALFICPGFVAVEDEFNRCIVGVISEDEACINVHAPEGVSSGAHFFCTHRLEIMTVKAVVQTGQAVGGWDVAVIDGD